MTTDAIATETTQSPIIARRERRSFTPEFKAAACERIRQGTSFVEVSSDLKVHEHLLREWTKKAGVKRGDALRPTPASTPQTVGESKKGVNKSSRPIKRKKTIQPERRANSSNDSDLVRTLRAENASLREENEFVRRVARMFAAQPEAATGAGRTRYAANG